MLLVGKKIFKIGIAGSNHKKGENGVPGGKGTPGDRVVMATGWEEGSRQSRELTERKKGFGSSACWLTHCRCSMLAMGN